MALTMPTLSICSCWWLDCFQNASGRAVYSFWLLLVILHRSRFIVIKWFCSFLPIDLQICSSDNLQFVLSPRMCHSLGSVRLEALTQERSRVHFRFGAVASQRVGALAELAGL